MSDAYDRLHSLVPGFIDTAEHREDVVVYSLNRLPPKYVVSETGKAVTEALLASPQQRTATDIQVLEALKQVAINPLRTTKWAATDKG